MFLSSFESLRNHILTDQTVVNMLHLGPRTFDELSGEVVQNTSFVIRNCLPKENANGVYYRLIDGKNCKGKEQLFLEGKGRYAGVGQDNFEKIPGCRIGYWITKESLQCYENLPLSSISDAKKGMDTGDNNKYLRFWQEVSFDKFSSNSSDEKFSEKWVPYRKGGIFRKWYGNLDYIINWENEGEQITNSKKANIRSRHLYFKPCLKLDSSMRKFY
jgi:hypothetical protein